MLKNEELWKRGKEWLKTLPPWPALDRTQALAKIREEISLGCPEGEFVVLPIQQEPDIFGIGRPGKSVTDASGTHRLWYEANHHREEFLSFDDAARICWLLNFAEANTQPRKMLVCDYVINGKPVNVHEVEVPP